MGRRIVKTKVIGSVQNTIIGKIFSEVGDSLINETFADDLDFIISVKKITGIKSAKSFPVESGYRYEYKVRIDDDLGIEINDLKNQMKFEKIGMWVIYDFTCEVLRVTVID